MSRMQGYTFNANGSATGGTQPRQPRTAISQLAPADAARVALAVSAAIACTKPNEILGASAGIVRW